MIEPQDLTRDRFIEALREQLDALRQEGIDVPLDVGRAVEESVVGNPDPFDLELFRFSAAHLLNGLDTSLADSDEGIEELGERLMDLPANLMMASRRAAARPELSAA